MSAENVSPRSLRRNVNSLKRNAVLPFPVTRPCVPFWTLHKKAPGTKAFEQRSAFQEIVSPKASHVCRRPPLSHPYDFLIVLRALEHRATQVGTRHSQRRLIPRLQNSSCTPPTAECLRQDTRSSGSAKPTVNASMASLAGRGRSKIRPPRRVCTYNFIHLHANHCERHSNQTLL